MPVSSFGPLCNCLMHFPLASENHFSKLKVAFLNNLNLTLNETEIPVMPCTECLAVDVEKVSFAATLIRRVCFSFKKLSDSCQTSKNLSFVLDSNLSSSLLRAIVSARSILSSSFCVTLAARFLSVSTRLAHQFGTSLQVYSGIQSN